MSFEILTTYIFPFIFVLTAIVFVHELGHYLAARRNGVKVQAFSIGFGPELFGFTDRNETRWKFCLIPLGGYVKMFSDADAASRPDREMMETMSEEDKKYALAYKPVWARIEVSAAGPLFNFLFAIAVLSMLYMTMGQRVPSIQARVGLVAEAAPAQKAGLKSGDLITRLNGAEVKDFQALIDLLTNSTGDIAVEYQRDTESYTVQITPEEREGRRLIGITPGFEKVRRGFFESWFYAAVDTYNVVALTLNGLGEMLMGKRSVDGLSGPIGIARMTGEVATGGAESLIWFMAFLSINLGFINLLPIPMLDGGHILFYLVEAITRRPVSERMQEYAFRAGFFFLISLFLFTTFKDLGKFEFIKRLISQLGW